MPTRRISDTPHPTPDSEAWNIIRSSIASLPDGSVAQNAGFAALNQLEESNRRRFRILGLVQEALSQLRLDMKYLIYDLECTRDERDKAVERLGE